MTTEAVRRALQASGVRPLRVPDAGRALGSGYAADAYLVRTAEGARVLRLPKAPLSYSAPLLQREARLLHVLERYDLGVTTPRGMRPIRDGRAFLGTIHEYVEGTPFASRLPGVARERLCTGIGRFLAALHAVPTVAAIRAGAVERDLWPDLYRGLIAETLPQLGGAARAWLAQTADDFVRDGGTQHAPRVLVHGDIQQKHLLVDEHGALSGVIDFGEAQVADPALDFAGVLNQLAWTDLERVWVAYRAAGGRLDTDVERRVRFYIAVVPIYRVLYGEAAEGPAERLAGIRHLAARAAAATRRGASSDG